MTVQRRSYPQSEEYWDGNWVNATISVTAGRFTGRIPASLRTNEFAGFLADLRRLHSTLEGEGRFESMERWLTLEVQGDGLGHFQAKCTVLDEAGCGNRLNFDLTFDQTDIPRLCRELEAILHEFPVVASPKS